MPVDAVVDQPAQRIVEAADLLPDGGAVTGWASLHLAGARYFDGTRDDKALPVLLAMGPRGHRQKVPGVAQHRQSFLADEVIVRHGVPCLCVERAVLDEMRAAGELWEATRTLDMAMYAELTSQRRFRAYVEAQGRREHLALAWQAVDLSDEGSQSRQETSMRLVWVTVAGLPRPLCNIPVLSDEGRCLGQPDLLDPIAGVVGEYDGAHHRETTTRRRDIGREELFREHGLEYFSVVAGEMHDREAVARRMHAARARARASNLPRRWRLGTRDLSLDERITLRAGGRRWL